MIKKVKEGYQVLSSKGKPSADHTRRSKKRRNVFGKSNSSSIVRYLSEEGIKAIEANFLPVGDPRQVNSDQAKNLSADLIVVGSHGYGAVDRFMLGSVSESVATHAHRSVEVNRE